VKDRLLNVTTLTFGFFIYYLLCEQTIQCCEKMDNEERPTTVYDHQVVELSGKTWIEKVGIEILYYNHTEKDDIYESYTMRFPDGICPSGILTLSMTKRTGEHVSKHI
jgi:hypothetical protein